MQLSKNFGSEDWLIRVVFVEIGVIFVLLASIVLYWKIYGPSIDRLLSGKNRTFLTVTYATMNVCWLRVGVRLIGLCPSKRENNCNLHNELDTHGLSVIWVGLYTALIVCLSSLVVKMEFFSVIFNPFIYCRQRYRFQHSLEE